MASDQVMVKSLLDSMADDPSLAPLRGFLESGGACSARGAFGSSNLWLSAALVRSTQRPVVLVTAHIDDADEAIEELEGLGIEAECFPALEVLPGESAVSLDLLSRRLSLVRGFHAGVLPRVLVTPVAALMQGVPTAERMEALLRRIREGDSLDLPAFMNWMTEAGYQRTDTVENPCEFAMRGGILDVHPPSGAAPFRLDLFGDEVERIFEIDLATQASDRRLKEVELVGATLESLQTDEGAIQCASLLAEDSIAVLCEVAELTEQARGYWERIRDARGVFGPPAVFKAINERCRSVLDVNQFSPGVAPDRSVVLPVEAMPNFHEETTQAFSELIELTEHFRTLLFCENEGEANRTRELLDDCAGTDSITLLVSHLHRGFCWAGKERVALVPQHELLHRYATRRRVARVAGGRDREVFVRFEPGDHVVHRDHGICRFLGLQRLDRKDGVGEEEFLTLEFDGGTKIHVPASKIELVQKYIGAGGARPRLSVVGGKRWKKQKEQVREAVQDLAAEMLRVQAARESTPGIRFPADTPWQREFEAEFPYEETEDQLAAIEALKRDMSGPRPMDRLLCGDVGFGKTEVAIRSAFKAVEYGKQVAVLVPTTVLAEQHERTFSARFRAYPFRVESLSRFKTPGESKTIIGDIAAGRVDVVIGTHRILSKDMRFKDLGLVIIDEEQRFGVEHKQRLLRFRTTSDVLTLSATPIPRTLHMAMLGLRDISSLTTAPLDRRAIVTEVTAYNEKRIAQAISRELARDGQVFFVHNRVSDLGDVAARIQQLAPGAKVDYGHGQMSARNLEQVMLRFVRGETDILVSTSIIESGIDIASANTIIINNAQNFGLSDLHQLRGRVGRHKHRAYCYLLLPPDRTIAEDSMKRLKAIEDFSMLGAGFKIAMRDLEIRGAGNLLGSEQSGHIAAVGYEMYCQLLEQSVAQLRKQTTLSGTDTIVEIGTRGSISKHYIPSDNRRMEAYRRIGQADSLESLERTRDQLESAYGTPPSELQELVDLAQLRLLAAAAGIRSVILRDEDVIFRTSEPRVLEQAMKGVAGSLRLVGTQDATGHWEFYFRPPANYLVPATLLAVLRKRLTPEPVPVP
ncbi:MAG: transcription-repair coupling factor [Planctomycetes bacterium TMED75]|nr:transcription-repair coupling factor [Planctomycetaceae bacterium]OUU90571.1 MAG: transcription-repair coupling factor [Planctomycetes bacterium TMED75]